MVTLVLHGIQLRNFFVTQFNLLGQFGHLLFALMDLVGELGSLLIAVLDLGGKLGDLVVTLLELLF